MVHADWCSICNTFKNEVLNNDTYVNQIKDQIVFAMIDGDKTYGQPYATQYNVSGYPTFLVLDKNGVEITRKFGKTTGDEFISFITPYLK